MRLIVQETGLFRNNESANGKMGYLTQAGIL